MDDFNGSDSEDAIDWATSSEEDEESDVSRSHGNGLSMSGR
jgi:hypothetical protein